MPDYRHDIERLLTQHQCVRVEHLGVGIWKWYSPRTKIAFSVESYIPTQREANEILRRAGIAAVVKPPEYQDLARAMNEAAQAKCEAGQARTSFVLKIDAPRLEADPGSKAGRVPALM